VERKQHPRMDERRAVVPARSLVAAVAADGAATAMTTHESYPGGPSWSQMNWSISGFVRSKLP
jgi:hypothetical protein